MKNKHKVLKAVALSLMVLSSGAILASCGNGGDDDISFKLNFFTDTEGNNRFSTIEAVNGEGSVPTSSPTKSGFVFTGWYVDAAWSTPFDPTAKITSNLNLYAGWHELPVAPTSLGFDAKKNEAWFNVSSLNLTHKVFLTRNGEVIENGTVVTPESGNKVIIPISKPGNYEMYVVVNDGSYDSLPSRTYSFSIAEPTFSVKFMNGSTTFAKVELDEDHKLVLPEAPTKGNAKFEGWFLDETFRTALDVEHASTQLGFDLDGNSDQTVSVYAKWAIKPEAPEAPDFGYVSAKAGQAQTLNIIGLSDEDNVKEYKVKVLSSTGTVILEQTVSKDNKVIVLDSSLFTENQVYKVYLKTVSKDVWEEKNIESVEYRSQFTYTVVPQDQYLVSFYSNAEDTTPFDTKSVAEGNAIVVPSVNPTKKGYVFDCWTLEDGSALPTTPITGDVKVVAKWTKLPEAPTSVTYNASTLTLSWAEVAGASEYQYSIDGGRFVKTNETSIQLFGLELGQHEVTLRVSFDGLTSEDSVCSFNVDSLYVAKVYNGEIIGYVEVVDGKILEQGAPTSMPTTSTFVKWNFDGKAGSAAINFASDTFEETTKIYAITVETPIGVEANSIIYDEESDTISWDAVEGATQYKVTFKQGSNSFTLYVTSTNLNNSFVANINNSGNYYIKIETRVQTDLGVIKATTAEKTLEIALATKTVYSDDGSLIKVQSGEKTTYVYFAGQTYSMSGTTFASNDLYEVSASGNVITMTADSDKINQEATMTYTDANGVIQTRTFKVVPQVIGLDVKGGYDNYITKTSAGDTTFINKTNTYKVGTAQTKSKDFVVDLDMSYGKGATFNDTDVDFDVTFKIDDVVTNDVSLAKEGTSYVLKFSRVYSTGTLEMSISPKFVNKDNYDAVNQQVKPGMVKTFTFELNEGVNVYTNKDLKNAMSDLNVHKINILADTIVAELDANQINSDGTPVCYTGVRYSKTYTQADANPSDPYSPLNNIGEKVQGHVYFRYVNGTDGDEITINGNYATIDGSQLPLVDNAGAVNGYNAEQATYVDSAVGGKIQTTHVGIMAIVQTQGSKETKGFANDLRIIGNTGIYGTTTADAQKWSGGYNGLRALNSIWNSNNCNIQDMCIGVYQGADQRTKNNYAVHSELITGNCWANGIYSHGPTHISVLKSKIGTASGAAIHLEERDVDQHTTPLYDTKAEYRVDPGLLLDTETRIDNWMFGDGPYFMSYGFSAMVPAITSSLESNVNNFGRTILVPEEIEGVAVNKFNFAVMFRPLSDGTATEYTKINTETGERIDMAFTGGHISDDNSNSTSYGVGSRFTNAQIQDPSYNGALYYKTLTVAQSGTSLHFETKGEGKVGDYTLKAVGAYATAVVQTNGTPYTPEQGLASDPTMAGLVEQMLNDYDKAIIKGLYASGQLGSGSSFISNMVMSYAYHLLDAMAAHPELGPALPLSSYPLFTPIQGNQELVSLVQDAVAGMPSNGLFWAMLETMPKA